MRISDWSSDVCSSDLESPCSCVCPRFDPYLVAQTLHGFSHRRVIVDDVHDRILVRLGLHPTSSPPSWHKSACASIESIFRFHLRCSASCWSSAFVWERWTGCADADSFANGLYETEAPSGASERAGKEGVSKWRSRG